MTEKGLLLIGVFDRQGFEGYVEVLRNCKTPEPKVTRVKEGGKITINRQYFDGLPLIEKCLPMFFERLTILVNGVKAAF